MKNLSYITVAGSYRQEIIIQKSRFIAFVQYIHSEKEAHHSIQSIVKKHRNASHHCYAYSLGYQGELQRFSDDGEPSGTAGKPILDVIQRNHLTQTLVVVTRYFGGVKLGAGGLARAYTSSAATGLKGAALTTWSYHQQVLVRVNYSSMGKVEHELRQQYVEIETPTFTDHVLFSFWAPIADKEKIENMINEQTSGTGQVEWGEEKYLPSQKNPPLPS